MWIEAVDFRGLEQVLKDKKIDYDMNAAIEIGKYWLSNVDVGYLDNWYW